MKTRRLISTLGSLLSFVSVYSQNDLPAGVSKDWYTQQVSSINDMQYNFGTLHHAQNVIVNNPANHLGFVINPSGYQVHNINVRTEKEKWYADFKLEKSGNQPAVNAGYHYSIARKDSSSIIYQSDILDIEYINTSKGLRQNFTINEKQQGGKNLSIAIKISTSLMVAVKNGNRLLLSDRKNEKDIKLIYDQLKVWDAKGTILPSSMKYNKQTGLLSIIAEDRDAVYPVTIDPLNRAPEWTTSADGILPGLLNNLQLQVQTAYGYTVAGLGDVNGDGYDDVAVGAPTMADVITGTGSLTGVGAVFIYFGSASGLSSTPGKILQPTTPVNGALFGFSIAAGDITGDGKNDIIIGAPLDSYQTTASSLLGSTSVNVRAGKVYVYRSEDLTATVPSPFLQIRLQGTAYFSTGIAGILLSNVNVNSLFGFSVATVKDINGDGKDDIVIGCPAYLAASLLSVQSGSAFVYYSNNLATTSPVQLNTPTPTLLGLASLPLANTSGLLFGFSVDGAGDYNNDGFNDIVVGAPAGINLNSLAGIFTGQFLGGSAYVFYGSGAGVQNTSTVRLQASPSGLLSNAANLFGYKVKGAKNAIGSGTGNILVGSPAGAVLSNIVGGLQVKAGEVHVFKAKTPSATGAFVSDQTLSSPRSSSVLSILSGQTIDVSLLYGASIDNMLDVNCDNIGDIIVGEPLSTNIPVLGANVAGGAAYIYLGKADGTYQTTPFWDLNTEISPLLGVNATSLIGFSVAGAGYVKGHSQGVRSLVGGPSNALDFGAGLLNLGNTLGTTFDFAFDNNGLGKAYDFSFANCTLTLPVKLLSFTAEAVNSAVELKWASALEENLNYYDLERSYDGIHFERIAMVFAKEAQNDDYNYPDKKPFKTVNYYRLKMVDKDSKYSYSNIVSVQFKGDSQVDIMVAPNPVVANINLLMTGLQKGVYRVELRNTAGQVFVNKSITVSQYSQTEIIPRRNMSPGMYWISIYDNTNFRVTSTRVVLN